MVNSKLFFVTMNNANSTLSNISKRINSGFWVIEDVLFQDPKGDYLVLDKRVESFKQILGETADINVITNKDFQWLTANNHLLFDWSGVYYFKDMNNMDNVVSSQTPSADFIGLSLDGERTWLISTKLFNLEEIFILHKIKYEVIEDHSIFAERRYDLM